MLDRWIATDYNEVENIATAFCISLLIKTTMSHWTVTVIAFVQPIHVNLRTNLVMG